MDKVAENRPTIVISPFWVENREVICQRRLNSSCGGFPHPFEPLAWTP
jgi:hypothetical protein